MSDLCSHCQLPIAQGVSITSETHSPTQFCCLGCKAVYELIAKSGMSELYSRKFSTHGEGRGAPPTLQGLPNATMIAMLHRQDKPSEAPCDLPILPEYQRYADFDAVRPFIKIEKNAEDPQGDHWELMLRLSGMNCAACSWISEHALQKLSGVISAHVNMVTALLWLRIDPRRINVAQVLSAIHEIGYRGALHHPDHPSLLLEESPTNAQALSRSLIWKLFVSGFATMQAMSFSVPLYFADVEGLSQAGMNIDEVDAALLRWTTLMIAIPSIIFAGWDYFSRSWIDLRRNRIGMDLPIALGLIIGVLHSAWITVVGGGNIYFDSMTMLLFILLCGRYAEQRAQSKIRSALLGTRARRAVEAWQKNPYGLWALAPLSQLSLGDSILVKHGETIPVDGIFVHNEPPSSSDGAINESVLTGESAPVAKHSGEMLHEGTINLGEPFIMRVSALGRGRLLQEIEWMVTRALCAKPRFIALAMTVARYFIVVLLALVAFAMWFWVEHAGWNHAIKIIVALLVVTCPCALALAAPLTLAGLMANLLRKGLLLQNVAVLEHCHRTKRVFIDKTGTLTEGRIRLHQIFCNEANDWNPTIARALAEALESTSEHPIANGIGKSALSENTSIAIHSLQRFPHQGIEGIFQVAGNDQVWRIGNAQFCGIADDEESPLIRQWQSAEGGQAYICIFLAQMNPAQPKHRCCALLVLEDTIRPHAKTLIQSWQAQGIRVALLSGDRQSAVQAMAKTMGIDEYYYQHTPAQKGEIIRAHREHGEVVMMIGDGVNDAPVMALADVSVGMPNASELSKWSADIVLLPGAEPWLRLQTLMPTLQFARKLLISNYAWAIAYNLVMIPLAMSGWVNPWVAGVGMTLSSLIVMGNSLRLLR